MEIKEKRSGVTYIQTVNAVMLVVVAQTTWGSVSGCKSSSKSALAEEGTLSPWFPGCLFAFCLNVTVAGCHPSLSLLSLIHI